MILTDECSICQRDVKVDELHLPELICLKCQPHNPWSQESREHFKKLKQKQFEWLRLQAWSLKTKRCTKCNRKKLKEYFNKDKNSLDGRRSECRVCTKKIYQQWKEKAYSLDY